MYFFVCVLSFNFRSSGLQLGRPVIEIQLKMFIPKLELHANTNGGWKIILLSVKPRAVTFWNRVRTPLRLTTLRYKWKLYFSKIHSLLTENIVVFVILKIDVVQRYGKDYMVDKRYVLQNRCIAIPNKLSISKCCLSHN